MRYRVSHIIDIFSFSEENNRSNRHISKGAYHWVYVSILMRVEYNHWVAFIYPGAAYVDTTTTDCISKSLSSTNKTIADTRWAYVVIVSWLASRSFSYNNSAWFLYLLTELLLLIFHILATGSVQMWLRKNNYYSISEDSLASILLGHVFPKVKHMILQPISRP